ncbi:hypothetical protein [Ralstonia pseudosolanacearum]|uniref:hypothetical protein n=3 Tax=Ralstonia pseudosolanacearum TaxID=1310165 RepID=UPI00090C7FA7|nr:hypothetical protein [Ralstonia solanacearum]BCM05577.1 hypothetical protein MAFF301560_49640 [Ralstonia solanacearum]BEU49642.1 hypothetical protein MAFF211519_49670 [Ralstonia pseudosolanacearum]
MPGHYLAQYFADEEGPTMKTVLSRMAGIAALVCSGVAVSAETATACDPLDQRVRATRVAVGGNVSPSDEYTPTVIAPRADGTAVLAWTDTVSKRIRLSTLTANDVPAQSLPSVDGLQVHAALATANGGLALAVVADDPDIYSPKYCYSASTPDNAVCGKMDLVLLRGNGSQIARTTLTKKANADSVGAQFIWWYGHTARLATDGKTIEVYFRSAMSTARPGVAGEVDIHAGDTLKFVRADTGAPVPGGWDWGCSHSWSVRAGYNGAQWAAACHGDAYPNAMQYVHMAAPAARQDTLQWLSNTDPSRRALGGLVPAGNGFWLNYIEPAGGKLSLKLAKLPNSGTAMTPLSTVAAATSLDTAYPFRPYMAAYGTNQLLMGWKSGGKLVLAVADAATGKMLEGPVKTALSIDAFQEMVTTASGDVVWAHSDGGGTIAVNRVAACQRSN